MAETSIGPNLILTSSGLVLCRYITTHTFPKNFLEIKYFILGYPETGTRGRHREDGPSHHYMHLEVPTCGLELKESLNKLSSEVIPFNPTTPQPTADVWYSGHKYFYLAGHCQYALTHKVLTMHDYAEWKSQFNTADGLKELYNRVKRICKDADFDQMEHLISLHNTHGTKSA